MAKPNGLHIRSGDDWGIGAEAIHDRQGVRRVLLMVGTREMGTVPVALTRDQVEETREWLGRWLEEGLSPSPHVEVNPPTMDKISLFGSHVIGVLEAWDLFTRNGGRLARHVTSKMTQDSEAHRQLIEDANEVLEFFNPEGYLKVGADSASVASAIGSLMDQASELLSPEDRRARVAPDALLPR